ncbi:MAG: AsmA family protein, partial [Planctomycetota bacterium]
MGDRPPRKRRRLGRALLKWAFRVVATVLILVLLLLLVLPQITDTGPFKRMVTGRVERFLQDAEVRLETLRVAPLEGRLLQVEGFSIAFRDRPEPPILALESAECFWRPKALLDGLLHLREVRTESVALSLRPEDGQWNVLRILRPREEPLRLSDLRLPLDLRIDGFHLADARLTLESESRLHAEVRGLSAQGSAALGGLLEGEATVRAAAPSVEVRLPGAGMVLEAELRAGADAHHGAGQARLSAALSADVLRAAAEPFGEVSPEALAGALDVQVDVGTLEVPRAEFDLQVPGILTGSGSFSLRREEGWALEGENRFALDLDALADALPPAGAGPLRSLRLGGRLFGFGELGGRFPGGHVWTGGQLFGSGIVLGAEGDLPAPPGAGREARPVRACVDGLTFWLVHATDVFGGGGLGGIGAARLSGGVESLGLEAPGIAAFEGTRLSGGLAAEAPLPVPDAFAVRGGFSVDAARVSAPGLGEVSVPLEVGFATAGRDLTDARDAQIEVDQLSGAVGEIVPGFRVAGTATG